MPKIFMEGRVYKAHAENSYNGGHFECIHRITHFLELKWEYFTIILEIDLNELAT